MNTEEIFRAKFYEEKAAYDTLRKRIREAIEEYDLARDHTSHGRYSDCIRCKCAEAIEYKKPVEIRTRR